MPILNVDGVALIEDHWKTDHKILPKRKNMDTVLCSSSKIEDSGVDLNRNFAIDFGQVDNTVQDYLDDEWSPTHPKKKAVDPCAYNYAGAKAFSEPETVAFKNFLT
jgi:hypothetical protein